MERRSAAASGGESGASSAMKPSAYGVRTSFQPPGQEASSLTGSCARRVEQALRSNALSMSGPL
jgi:hypothetical protein